MSSGTSISLDEVRMPSLFGSSRHKRNPSSGLLDEYESLSTRRKPRTGLPFDLWRVLKYTLATVVAIVVIFFWKYEVHIELQLFSRGWIRETILPIVPASSTCFAPAHVASTSYNQTLALAPAYVELHAGMNMALGRDCYDFASTIPLHPHEQMILPRHTIFHLYWRHDLLPVGERQVALLHSILATQDPETTSVIFWTNAPNPQLVSSLPILAPLFELYSSRRLRVESVDKRSLARGTSMEGHSLLDLADQQAWVDGDLVRILVLYVHGGIWVDFDTILTGRDLRVLGEHEWVTQWDCYDKIYQPLNGAMMHFYQHSPYLCEMLYTMSTSAPPSKNSVDWGSRLYHKVWRSLVAQGVRPFQILPYCFTDGVSCRLDNRLPDPFDSTRVAQQGRGWGKGRWEQVESKVRNVWAVHLHNRWDRGFPKGGYIDEMVLKPIETKIEQYRGRSHRDYEL
ncbi:uncharacterized protein JCM15063_003955 [Sporobolomyces koalae]|uniref:uncharacterized protein n=1 Tax=Sporobolomyces koalae TaxID=500713 RepID=UPI00317A9DD2